MLDSTSIEFDTIQQQENIVIETARDIIQFRLDTTPNYSKYDFYREELERRIERINSPHPEIEGIMFESLFYLACRDHLSWETVVSTGLQDSKGIDFILEPESACIPIDVTLNKEKYPKKMEDLDKYTLLIPSILIYYDKLKRNKPFDLKSFLEDIYVLNNEILTNKNEDFQINGEVKKDSNKKVVSLSKNRQEEMLAILFIFSKPNS